MKDPLRHATLRQLQIFKTAAEHLSFAQTARELHLSQPAVSMQMHRFADSIGMELFEKRGRKQRLTRAGEALFPYVQRVIQTLREASEELDSLKGLKHGEVKVAMVTTARYFAPKLITQFREKFPDIDIDFSISNREKVIEKLENNQVDLAIMGRPPKRIPVKAEEFSSHPYVIIASPEHHLAGKKRLSPQKLMGEVFLAREPGSGTRMLMDHYLSENKLPLPPVREMTSNESIKQAVMAGMGLAFISKHTIGLECQTNNLKILNVIGLPILRTWYVLHLSSKPISPATEAFKTFMCKEAPLSIKRIFPGK